jgi:lactate permease
MICLIILLKFWKPADAVASERAVVHTHSAGTVLRAWIPYAFLVILVLLIGVDSIKTFLNQWTVVFPWPNLHNEILRVAPAVKTPGPYAATFNFNFFTASGTACMFACFLSAMALRMPLGGLFKAIGASARQLALPLLTVSSVLALAFLMNYCGATATLGLAFAATGALFPFFSALLGWLGVFLTGSDTSANALFGNLQVVTAQTLDLNPTLMAASNSSGGVMGKMISLQSIAVAAAAAGMPSSDESRLFRFTLKHSIFLASVLGLIVVIYAYVTPHWVR